MKYTIDCFTLSNPTNHAAIIASIPSTTDVLCLENWRATNPTQFAAFLRTIASTERLKNLKHLDLGIIQIPHRHALPHLKNILSQTPSQFNELTIALSQYPTNNQAESELCAQELAGALPYVTAIHLKEMHQIFTPPPMAPRVYAPAPGNFYAAPMHHPAPGNFYAPAMYHPAPGNFYATAMHHPAPGNFYAAPMHHTAPGNFYAPAMHHPAPGNFYAPAMHYPAPAAAPHITPSPAVSSSVAANTYPPHGSGFGNVEKSPDFIHFESKINEIMTTRLTADLLKQQLPKDNVVNLILSYGLFDAAPAAAANPSATSSPALR